MEEHLVLIHINSHSRAGQTPLSEHVPAQPLPMWQKQPRTANFNEASQK